VLRRPVESAGHNSRASGELSGQLMTQSGISRLSFTALQKAYSDRAYIRAGRAVNDTT
jgi:hypothetical protein